MGSPLSDLDEMVLRCRDEKARQLIYEAVASYKAGAFRAAIVTTWVAVCLDLIEKFREVALTGDRNAEITVSQIENIRETNDLGAALRFEREILTLAKRDFELLSPVEFLDLERLRDDRNRCAHPSLIAEENDYRPPAELARLHIVSAIEHVLQRPPVQGKAALRRLENEIFSEYFPTKSKEALTYLSNGPLKRPRDSLTRSIIVSIIKRMLEETKPRDRFRMIAALEAIAQMHGADFEDTLKKKLSQIIRNIPDSEMHVALRIAMDVPRSWSQLDGDVTSKLQSYVMHLPELHFEQVQYTILIPQLVASSNERIRKSRPQDFELALFWQPPAAVIARIIELFSRCSSPVETNIMSTEILTHSYAFTPEQVTQTVEAISANPFIRGFNRTREVVHTLRDNEHIPVDEFDALLISNNLAEFMHAQPADEAEQ